MNIPIEIPEEWQLLVECLRCALHDRPPPESIESADWGVLLRQARQHSVQYFLFPWLVRNIPKLFSSSAQVDEDSAPAAWCSLALEHLQTTIIRQQQTAEILRLFAGNQIDVIPLKGIWLSENIYDEPSQRPMVDVDLLVRKVDIYRAHGLLTKLGYSPKRNIEENEFICDESYYHPERKTFIELHWNVESLMSGSTAIPEIDKIWMRTKDSTILQHPVKIFPIEDQLCYLVQHILHHQFALSLKSYVDIALLILSLEITPDNNKLNSVAGDWKTGQAVPFVLNMVSGLFSIPVPDKLENDDTLQDAVTAVFELPEASTRTHEYNLLKYSKASVAGKSRIILNRIFMPRSFMKMHYPFAANTLLLPVAWLLRAISLIRTTGKEVLSAKASSSNLSNAASRAAIIKKLTAER